ncbi:hypothetical protein Loa_01471 [Legionella oakridgensis ATCC 33761 = DSM 21215]|uniref:Uncharacterized protein n=1 Tax=Legionella oakridgensis ATCC 33761 = DSM 21215 TaxID=1268635 RepID=W0B900_9GAMM|nr:hypothetical protein Loa_01471 [Legionella oakridgensis ATCC 33761 = DSM 21215]
MRALVIIDVQNDFIKMGLWRFQMAISLFLSLTAFKTILIWCWRRKIGILQTIQALPQIILVKTI